MFMKLNKQKITADISPPPPEGLNDSAGMLVKQINSSIISLKERKNSIYNEVSKKIYIEYDVDRIISTKSSLPKTML